MALPWDALFLASFAYSGYRTLGRWLKYTDETAKAQSDGAYLEGFREFLSQAHAEGERAKPNPGAGADASGQGHLWREWGGLKTKQRIALLNEMKQVLEWTGGDAAYRALKKHAGKPWSALPHGAKKALLAAADEMDWSFLSDMAAHGAAVASAASLWQVTEALPQLSAEPQLAEALLEDAAGLQELVSSADLAVNALLTGQQEVAIAALQPAQKLQVAESRRRLDLLKEAAQGGLGLGSGGKASRGQQLLELLRSLALVPASQASADAKAASGASLDAAADEAVAPLRETHAKALAASAANARLQALGQALASRISYRAGKAPLSAQTAAAVVDVAGEELAAAVSDGACEAAAASLAARRAAAERLLGMASLIDSTAAALTAALSGDDPGADATLQAFSAAADGLQEAAIKLAELRAKAPAAAAAAASAVVEDGGDPGDEAAPPAQPEDRAAAAAAAVEAALQAVREAVEGLPLAQPSANGTAEGESHGEAAAEAAGAPGESREAVKAEVMRSVAEQVAAAEERTKQQQETALQAARSRERMGLLLAKAKQLMTPPPPPAAAAAPAAGSNEAGGEGGEAAAAAAAPAEPQMSAAEQLQVTEAYLRQLGARPLAAALGDLDKLLAAAGAGEGDAAARAASLARGLELTADSSAALQQLGKLLGEIELADAVMRLELGPGVPRTLELLSAYTARLAAQHAARAAGEGGSSPLPGPGGPEPRVSTPPSVGVSPNLVKEQEAIDKCSELVGELRRDGLVALGLSPAQYRTLQLLKDAAGSLSAELDALKYDRCVTVLKDVAAQLGPIGAAIQVRLADTTDEALRGLMAEQKALAVDLYARLQAFLSFEESSRGPLKKALRELGSLAGGIGAPRTPSGCATASLKLEMAAEEGQRLQELLAGLAESGSEGGAAPPGDSLQATQRIVADLQGSVEAMQAGLASLAAHVALRAHALNPETAASAAASGVQGEDLDLASLEAMQPELNHPLTLLGAASPEQQGEWEMLGFEQIARGRVAAVLLATATADGHDLDPAGDAAGPAAPDGTPRAAVPLPGLPSGKSCLQLCAERLLRLQALAAAAVFGPNAPVTRPVHWYIMTSPATHDKLAALLRERRHFGLAPSQVHLFRCAAAPPAFAGEPLRALTLGAATLTRGAPGSGEVFAALQASGSLRHMKRNGAPPALWRPALDPWP